MPDRREVKEELKEETVARLEDKLLIVMYLKRIVDALLAWEVVRNHAGITNELGAIKDMLDKELLDVADNK